MKTFGKRIVSLIMMFLICAVTIFGNVNTAKATEVADGTTDTTTETPAGTPTDITEDDKTTVLVQQIGNATANTEVLHDFTVDVNEGVGVVYFVQSPCNAVIGIVDSANEWYADSYDEYAYQVYTSDWAYDAESGLYYIEVYTYLPIPAGDYSVVFTPDVSVTYAIYALAANPAPELSQTKLTISVGMKETLEVENTDEVITWKSSKPSVAKVNTKGVITAKKAGKATITATTESGVVLKCKVTVKANKFTETKLKVSDLTYDQEGVLQVYSASYDSKGNLVIKCRFINNCGYKVTKLEKIKIQMVTDEGKIIGTYTADSKKMTVADGATKDFSVTIKKSKLKIKKADLRNATYHTDGEYYYNY